MTTVERMLTYAALGAALGGAAGFLLPPIRESGSTTVGMGAFLHLALLGVLLAIPGPAMDLGLTGVLAWLGKRTVRLFEIVTVRRKPPLVLVIEERKLSAAIVGGAITVSVLALCVLGVSPYLAENAMLELVVFAAAFALFPAVLTIVDCVVDHVYRAIAFEAIFAGVGGLLGLACAFACWIMILGVREQLAAGAAVYGALTWLFIGLGKTVEEKEEEIEAREDAEERSQAAEGEACDLAAPGVRVTTEPPEESAGTQAAQSASPGPPPDAEAAPPTGEGPTGGEAEDAEDKPST